jgi:hypothetical protein
VAKFGIIAISPPYGTVMAGAVFVVVTFEPRLPKEVRMATTRVKTKRALK